MPHRPVATPSQAIAAIARLLGEAAAGTGGPDGLRRSLVAEGRGVFGVAGCGPLAGHEGRGLLTLLAADPAIPALSAPLAIGAVPGIGDLLAQGLPTAHGTLAE